MASIKPTIPAICENCGASFLRRPAYPTYPASRFCSVRCSGNARRSPEMASMPNRDWRPVSVVCAECGALLKRKLFDTMTYKPIENFFCNKACKGLWQKRAKPVSRDWLFQKYAIENLDCSQIGKIVNRDPKSVWNWLVDFGIERRKRGYATIEKGFGFRKGEPSKFKGHQQKRGSDSPFWKGGITAERQAFYASAEWKAVCQIVYGRAAAQCERCGSSRRQQHRLGRRLHVHHIIPFDVKSTRALADNLAVLCRPCHLFVHSNANLIGEFIAVPVDTRRIKRGRPKGN